MDLLQRLLLLGLAAAAVIWAFVRFALPWLGKREDDTDMALLVQRQAGIDSDLVAALQFESADAAYWGSTQLETAVIDRVAVEQKKLDVMAAMPRQPLARRLKLLIATVAVWALLGFFAAIRLDLLPAACLRFAALSVADRGGSHQRSTARVSIFPRLMRRSCMCRVARRFALKSRSKARSLFRAAWRLPSNPVARRQMCLWTWCPAEMATRRGPVSRRIPGLSQSARYQVYLGDAWTEPLALV